MAKEVQHRLADPESLAAMLRAWVRGKQQEHGFNKKKT